MSDAAIHAPAGGLDAFSSHRVAAQAAPSRLDGATTAVLVVDMLNDFCVDGGAMVLPGAERLYPAIDRLTAAARAAGSPVVWICDRHETLEDAEFRKREPHCLAGTWGAEVVDALHREPGDHESPKHRFSAFFETGLHTWLSQRGVRTLVLCGVVTNICVRSTAHDAFFLGYDVLVAEDACAATGPREQESSLYDIETHFGRVSHSGQLAGAFGAPGEARR